MRWTEAHYSKYMAKDKEDAPESALQKKIVQYCKAHGYPCHYHPQSRAAIRAHATGWPDVVVAMKGGRTLYLELKSKTGALRKEQREIAMQMKYLGHEWYKVKTYKRFMEIIGCGAQNGTI